MQRIMWIILLCFLIKSSEERNQLNDHSVCLPHRTNGSCVWNLFGWKMYRGCGYQQNINEHLCIIKQIDGSKGTFLTKINVSSNHQYCLRFQYLITGAMVDVCWNFYGKTRENSKNPSRLFSIFCIPNNQSEYQWYPFHVSLPVNITMINVVTDSQHIGSNHSLIIKNLLIQTCDPMNTHLFNSTSFVEDRVSWTRYIWILIIILLVLPILFSMMKVIQHYQSHRTLHQQPIVIERMPTSPPNPSQHFYEQPISIILPPSIEISVYDHVQDNYI